jgi:Methyltransferase domain
MNKFFDDYPNFYETSTTTANSARLNFRYHLIIEQNEALLKGKRVVEIATHDGRWAFAALQGGGAAHVTGVEPRQHLVDNANKTLTGYGIDSSRFNFICGDGFVEAERMGREGQTFDTAMVLGFLYHTARQYEIIFKLAALGVRNIIVDTAVLKDVTQPIVRVGIENTGNEARLHSGDKEYDLGGVPSLTAVHLMLKAAGFQPSLLVHTVPPPVNGCGDYREGKRFTIIGTR